MHRTTRSSGQTPSPQARPPAKGPLSGLWAPLACLTIVAAGLAAYCDSFDGPFIFDDDPSIINNPTIRQLWPVGPALTPPGGRTVACRPVANLSLAVNWAIGQDKVLSYHLLNLAIHLAAALTLFGVIRRTLRQPRLSGRFAGAGTGIAFATALIWTVHPLQTESVTYIVQRTESIMGLFYLLTLYCVIRGAAAARPNAWYVLSVMACLSGMASKEVMATAPLVVLLYDRTFLSGTFKDALRRRWPLYVGLACTWGLLAYLMAGSTDRGGSAGFGLSVTAWQYAVTQLGVITHYLRLAFWPAGLVLDYGWPVASSTGQILPGAIVIGLLLAGTIWALIRNSTVGFLGACFFLILAPTSSFVPLLDAAFEHRMYLPLAAVAALVVTVLYRAWQWLVQKVPPPRRPASAMRALPPAVLAIVTVALGYGTFERNKDYRTSLAIWQDTLAKRPDNPRAHSNLGVVLAEMGRGQEAIPHYERALQLNPHYAEAENNYGVVLTEMGRAREAILHCQRALQLVPDYAKAENNLGFALAGAGRTPEAIPHYERALQLKPDYAVAENNLGLAWARVGRVQDAAGHYERALQLKPDYAEAENNLGVVLAEMGRIPEAIPHYERALQWKPDYAEAENNLGLALGRVGRVPDAIAHFERAVRLKPDYADAENNLGVALAGVGRAQEATAHYERALQLRPQDAEAEYNLGLALARVGRVPEAIPHFERAVKLKPDYADAENNLGAALARVGRVQEAIAHFERALQLRPDDAAARDNLARIRSSRQK
jgi:tetratricopeptide (TPR) repeat protein